MIEFDRENHIYRANGVIIPSVTQALQVITNFDHVPFEILESARQFGSHVHQATDLYDRGELDEENLDVALIAYLGGWKRFLEETRCTVLASEQIVHHEDLGYCGTLDKRILWKNTTWLIDLKSGAVTPGSRAARSHGPQTAAYREALPKSERPRRRMVLQLLRNNYCLYEQTNPADWSIFVSCLNITRFLNRSKEEQHSNARSAA